MWISGFYSGLVKAKSEFNVTTKMENSWEKWFGDLAFVYLQRKGQIRSDWFWVSLSQEWEKNVCRDGGGQIVEQEGVKICERLKNEGNVENNIMKSNVKWMERNNEREKG